MFCLIVVILGCQHISIYVCVNILLMQESNNQVTVLQDTGLRIFEEDDKFSSIWVSGLQNVSIKIN